MKKETERWSSSPLEQAMPRCHGSTVSPVSVGTAESCCSSTLPLGERERENERRVGGKGRRKTVTERRVQPRAIGLTWKMLGVCLFSLFLSLSLPPSVSLTFPCQQTSKCFSRDCRTVKGECAVVFKAFNPHSLSPDECVSAHTHFFCVLNLFSTHTHSLLPVTHAHSSLLVCLFVCLFARLFLTWLQPIHRA